ncbi:MAG: FapA family protein [Desulfobacterales bacterium]|nr:FapA family protein [Desulfobacterales bacterium]
MIGLLAVRNQLITKTELENGLRSIADTPEPEEALKQYFLANELISAKNIERLFRVAKALEIRKKEFKFGAIAVRKGIINQSLLTLALEEQEADIRNQKKPRLIGDMLVESGLMTPRQRDAILKMQKRVRSQPKPEVAPPEDAADENSTPEEPPVEEALPITCHILEETLVLQVDADRMAAHLTKTDTFTEDVSAREIKEALYDQGIISGIMVDEMIEGFIRSSGYRKKGFRVAKGVRPIHGQDGKIEYFFNTDYLKAGGMDGSGNIDFRQRGQVPHVEPGTLLAEKTPMVPFRQGKNIYGEIVETSVGRDVHLKFGKGAVLSEDGLKVLAGAKGYPKFSLAGVIFVHQTYTAPGDVDYETGHIDFEGNVRVVGGIKSGFKVHASDIEAKSLDGGIIQADGDLIIKGGIVEGTIHARGNVFARFIHKSEIVCMGNVVVAKEIVDTTIESSGFCAVEYGKIISSNISAKMGIQSKHVGTEMAVPCSLQVGLDIYARNELTKIRNMKNEAGVLLDELKEKQASLEEKKEVCQEKITQLAHIQDRSQLAIQDCKAELQQLIASRASAMEQDAMARKVQELESSAVGAEDGLEALFHKSDTLDGELHRMEKKIETQEQLLADLIQEKTNLAQWSRKYPGKAEVKVVGTIQPGTMIRGRHSAMAVDQLLRTSKIKEISGSADDNDAMGPQYRMVVTRY